MSKQSQGRIIKITALFLSFCQEHELGNFCLHAICPKGMEHMFMELGLVVYWPLCESMNSLQPFSKQFTVSRVARLEAKSEKLTINFIFRVYGHD